MRAIGRMAFWVTWPTTLELGRNRCVDTSNEMAHGGQEAESIARHTPRMIGSGNCGDVPANKRVYSDRSWGKQPTALDGRRVRLDPGDSKLATFARDWEKGDNALRGNHSAGSATQRVMCDNWPFVDSGEKMADPTLSCARKWHFCQVE